MTASNVIKLKMKQNSEMFRNIVKHASSSSIFVGTYSDELFTCKGFNFFAGHIFSQSSSESEVKFVL